MTAINQNFKIYVSDVVFPRVTVKTQAGALADLTTATEIAWYAVPAGKTSAVLTKRLTVSSGITLPNGGTDGLFQINLTSADTTRLLGTYQQYARIWDSLSQPTTIMVGTMTVINPAAS